MNDFRNPCEDHVEEISLLAAGCLTAQEEHNLREHLVVCEPCRQRLEEMTTICSAIGSAKPVLGSESIRISERCLQHLPVPDTALVRERQAFQRYAPMLAVAGLIVFAVLRGFASRPADPSDERPVDVVKGPAQVSPESPKDMPVPTLLALRRAAAESDESFDRLLSRYGDPSLFAPLNNQPSRQESLQ